MPDLPRLERLCARVEGRPYPAWKDLRGRWQLGDRLLIVDHVQGDPFAQPSRLRLRLDPGLPPELTTDEAGRVACADWILRELGAALRRLSTQRGSGRSGGIFVYEPGPEVVDRSSVRVDASGRVEIRLTAGLPARGRRILGHEGLHMLSIDLGQAAAALRMTDQRVPRLAAHVDSVRRQRGLREQLHDAGLVAFVADGSLLPRTSGIDQAPLAGAVPLTAPDSLAVTLQAPDGPVRGLGIRRGITLITGGGFHGKSTLLQAIQRGHLDHVPGDGRQAVVCVPDGVKIRAEDGRAVTGVDISPFLTGLPGGQATSCFSTRDASGSTSQAAAIVEAAESGATLLLLDEDTSATNLLVRDARMRRLIPRECEPITPLVERVQELYGRWGISTLMVVGGVGDFLAVADSVIGMDRWQPHDLGPQARDLAGPAPTPPTPMPGAPRPRRVHRASLRPARRRARASSKRQVDHGGEEIDLVAVEQVLDGAHARSLGHALRLLSELQGDEVVALPDLLDELEERLRSGGPDVLSVWEEPTGDLIRPRRHEVAAALNRLRALALELPVG